MLRLVNFTEEGDPGKPFSLVPVLNPEKGEPPWQLRNALAIEQVQRESATQFNALVRFVEGTGNWKLSNSVTDLDVRVQRNLAATVWLVLLGRHGWFECANQGLRLARP